MSRRRPGQHRKVMAARALAAQTLGDAARRDQPQAEKYVPTTEPTQRIGVKSEVIGVLTMKEAAVRLGVTAREVEAMVKSGRVKSLMAGWTMVLPTSDVGRLQADRRG